MSTDLSEYDFSESGALQLSSGSANICLDSLNPDKFLVREVYVYSIPRDTAFYGYGIILHKVYITVYCI